MATKIQIKQVKSSIGALASQKKTLVALGLRKINHKRIYPDNASIRGMVVAVRHLVEVSEVKEGGSK